jgi:hypothetical protein
MDRLVLAVSDVGAAREELRSHGIQVSEVFHDAGGGLGGGFYAGTEARASGADPQRRSYASYASFSDPDGNGWLLQEIKERLPGRVGRPRISAKIESSPDVARDYREGQECEIDGDGHGKQGDLPGRVHVHVVDAASRGEDIPIIEAVVTGEGVAG